MKEALEEIRRFCNETVDQCNAMADRGADVSAIAFTLSLAIGKIEVLANRALSEPR